MKRGCAYGLGCLVLLAVLPWLLLYAGFGLTFLLGLAMAILERI